MSENKPQGPVQTLRDGAVFAKLWKTESKKGPFISVALGRTYKDEQSGELREAHTLSGSDILKGHALLLEANREAAKWREHFKDQRRAQDKQPDRQAELPMQSEQTQAAPAEGQPQQQGLAAQRDEVLAHAKAPEPAASPVQDRMPDH